MEKQNQIAEYFDQLPANQLDRLLKTKVLYEGWNSKINVISRKDMDNFYERHVLHSLGIAKVINFKPGTKVMDVGTGGGFPGVPLAIMFPETEFLLVDSIGKKLKVIDDVALQLGLKNVKTLHSRAEKVHEQFDFVVSRAVTRLPDFMNWVSTKFYKNSENTLKNGVLYLKGGDFDDELASIKWKSRVWNLKDYYKEEFFETKKVVHIHK